MSVKSKVKRCNKEIKKLNGKIVGLEFELERRNNNLKRLIDKKEANPGYEFVESFVKYTYTGDTIAVGEGDSIETITGNIQPEDKIEITYSLERVD